MRRSPANAAAGAWIGVRATGNEGFETPAMDPMFMEPEAPHGTTRPARHEPRARYAVGERRCDRRTRAVPGQRRRGKEAHVIACYPGGGFGGRDKSYFPLYLALAAPFATGALRWQQSRYEQFQVGLKRCETQFSESLWFNRRGKLEAITCDFLMNGGGKKNLSPYVAQLAALSAMSCYDSARTRAGGLDLHAGSVRRITARLRRPQAFMAVETLMDEAARRLGSRRSRSVAPIFSAARPAGKGRAITGAPILFDRSSTRCSTGSNSTRWRERERTRAERAARHLRYGVGLAMANEAHGTSGDGMFGMVQILPDSRLRVVTPYTDMGNGAATTLLTVRISRQNAQTIAMSEIGPFNALSHAFEQPVGQSEDGALHVRFVERLSRRIPSVPRGEGSGPALFLQSVLPAPVRGGACPCGPRTYAGPMVRSSRTASRRFRGRRCSAPSRSWACRRWRPCMRAMPATSGRAPIRSRRAVRKSTTTTWRSASIHS